MKHFLVGIMILSVLIVSAACQTTDDITLEPETVEAAAVAWQSQTFDTKPVSTTSETIVLDQLQSQIQRYLEDNQVDPNLIAYSISDLETGREWHHNEALAFRAGSVYKLPMAMLYYDGINQGYFDPNQMLEYEDWIKETGGYIYEEFEYGDEFPLWDVLHYVIAYSDNVAGHMLYANYGGWYQMRSDALRYSQFHEEELYFDQGGYFTSRYLDEVIEYLYRHQAEYPTLMHNLAGAAPDTYLNSAMYGMAYQKVGNAEYFFNAAGMVLEDRPYSISVLTGFGEFGHIVMGKINEIAYHYFNPTQD